MKPVITLFTIVGLFLVCAGCNPDAAPDSSPAAVPSEENGGETAASDQPDGAAGKNEAQTPDAETGEPAHEQEPESQPDESTVDKREFGTGPEGLAAALKEKNPKFSGQLQVQPINTELLAVAINDRNVRDISPLKRQRIGALDLSKCDISDLSPLEGMPIMELYLEENERLSVISALRGMPLQKLYLSNTRVENLGPLRGAPLTEFNAVGSRIKDLSPLSESPIQMLWLTDCPVEDIPPLKKVPLVSLTLENTNVTDISPLAGHPLQRLHIGRCDVPDLTPVGKMQLNRLIFAPGKVKEGLDVVRQSPTLRELGTNFDNRMPPPTFWKMYDEGKLE